MTTYIPTHAEPGEANNVTAEEAREQGQSLARRRPRRGALAFASGFMLGAVTTAVASIAGRRRRLPLVVGNRNVFMSLPFSGISMAAPTSRGRGRGRRPNRFAAWDGKTRGRKRGR